MNRAEVDSLTKGLLDLLEGMHYLFEGRALPMQLHYRIHSAKFLLETIADELQMGAHTDGA